jgi:hypothetical protein
MTLAALAAGTPFLAPGTYEYTASLSGQPAATSKLTVAHNGGATDIDEDSSGSLGGMKLSGKATLVLGADLAPTQYNGNYESPAQKATVTVALTPTSATIMGSAVNGGPQALALSANTRHFVVIEPGLMAGLFALPAQVETWKDAAVTAIAPVTGRAQTLATNTAATSARPSDVQLALVRGPGPIHDLVRSRDVRSGRNHRSTATRGRHSRAVLVLRLGRNRGLLDHSSGYSDRRCIGRYVANDNRPGSDHRMIADRHAGHDDRA